MKYGITLLGNRVSPRCACTDSILFVSQTRNEIRSKKRVPVTELNIPDLCEVLHQNRADTLVCGGITRDGKSFLRAQKFAIIDNVACTAEKIIQAIRAGKLRHDYGFVDDRCLCGDTPEVTQDLKPGSGMISMPGTSSEKKKNPPDCLACTNRVCLEGKMCKAALDERPYVPEPASEFSHMLDAAADISFEKERTLCRLSELIYFCLEMQYERIGVAYCVELEEATEVLVKVLRRFFRVYPVCCKVGGLAQSSPLQGGRKQGKGPAIKEIACNPWGQARVLNRLGTDLNVMVGLCMGVDCVFIQGSHAPATALFVKDKSLANNPIGAIYSEYYLKEAARAHS